MSHERSGTHAGCVRTERLRVFLSADQVSELDVERAGQDKSIDAIALHPYPGTPGGRFPKSVGFISHIHLAGAFKRCSEKRGPLKNMSSFQIQSRPV